MAVLSIVLSVGSLVLALVVGLLHLFHVSGPVVSAIEAVQADVDLLKGSAPASVPPTAAPPQA